MRTCPNCSALIAHDSHVCPECQAIDFGWLECQEVQVGLPERYNRKALYDQQLVTLPPSAEIDKYKVGLSAFSNSAELGFHLYRIGRFLKIYPQRQLKVVCDGASWGYAWDYGGDSDPERDFYLPPSLPLPALVEVSRFILALQALNNLRLEIELILPPATHAATRFIEKTRLFSTLPKTAIRYAIHGPQSTRLQGCDDVLVPLVSVGPETHGQLSKEFYQNFNQLADAGLFKREHRSALRRVVMEAAENADVWGGGGWVVCFLRQEKRGASKFGYQLKTFSPARETHLFLHVFSLGPSLADSLGHETEWEATEAVVRGQSSRLSGGGKGMPSILRTVTERALGTVCLISGSYTHIMTPDGLVRAFHSAGTEYLPGVHVCAIVPLAVISKLDKASSVRLPAI